MKIILSLRDLKHVKYIRARTAFRRKGKFSIVQQFLSNDAVICKIYDLILKVLLTTSLGEIEIELWSKECPKAARNFVQLCLEGFYNGTIFHRVVPNFIAQGGDPTGIIE